MKKGISVILCTYNGKARLEKTFEYLLQQKLTIPAEVLLVDNASIDGTKSYSDTWWENHHHPHLEYRSLSQPIPGKSYAQDLGYSEAKYEYLLVCDDDNWLCDDYLQTAFEVMESNASIGALGGWCDAAFESEKPIWFDQFARFYAVGKQGSESGDITDKKGCLYGAGMVIRKSHWLALKENGFNHILSCRKGNSLSSGGDTEYSFALRLLGYELWYDERLFFTHFMSDGRLNLDYLSRLRKAMSDANFQLIPYKDVLKNRYQSSRKMKSKAYRSLKSNGLLQLRNYFGASYAKKEDARNYFRMMWNMLFNHKTYQANWDHIQQWLPTK